MSPGPDAGFANQLTDAQISAVATKLTLNSGWGRRYAADVVLTNAKQAAECSFFTALVGAIAAGFVIGLAGVLLEKSAELSQCVPCKLLA